MAAAHVASAAIRRLQNGHFTSNAGLSGRNRGEGRDPVVMTPRTPESEGGSRSISSSPSIPSLTAPFAPTTSSTPNRRSVVNSFYSETTDSESTSSCASPADETYDVQTRSGVPSEPPKFRAPILGYEIMEQRAKFTVFKIHVQHIASNEGWFVFRRYTDFARLNRKLRGLFPTLRFGLPPKRWFKDNFEQSFLDDRLRDLQTFVNNVLSFSGSSKSIPVQDFFCLDDPPGPHDSMEESRARCESLEELVSSLRVELCEKQVEVDLLRAELALTKAQKDTLTNSLRVSDEDTTILTADGRDSNETTQLYCTALEDGDDSTVVGVRNANLSSFDAATTKDEGLLRDREVARRKLFPFSMDSNGNQMVESNGVVLDVET